MSGHKVFNPSTALQHGVVDATAIQAAACNSKVMLVVLSPGYFGSKWCVKEAEAAMEAKIPVVPCFAGEEYGPKQMLRLMDKSDPLKRYIFQENIMDVHNTQHPDDVITNMQTIVRRFIDI